MPGMRGVSGQDRDAGTAASTQELVTQRGFGEKTPIPPAASTPQGQSLVFDPKKCNIQKSMALERHVSGMTIGLGDSYVALYEAASAALKANNDATNVEIKCVEEGILFKSKKYYIEVQDGNVTTRYNIAESLLDALRINKQPYPVSLTIKHIKDAMINKVIVVTVGQISKALSVYTGVNNRQQLDAADYWKTSSNNCTQEYFAYQEKGKIVGECGIKYTYTIGKASCIFKFIGTVDEHNRPKVGQITSNVYLEGIRWKEVKAVAPSNFSLDRLLFTGKFMLVENHGLSKFLSINGIKFFEGAIDKGTIVQNANDTTALYGAWKIFADYEETVDGVKGPAVLFDGKFTKDIFDGTVSNRNEWVTGKFDLKTGKLIPGGVRVRSKLGSCNTTTYTLIAAVEAVVKDGVETMYYKQSKQKICETTYHQGKVVEERYYDAGQKLVLKVTHDHSENISFLDATEKPICTYPETASFEVSFTDPTGEEITFLRLQKLSKLKAIEEAAVGDVVSEKNKLYVVLKLGKINPDVIPFRGEVDRSKQEYQHTDTILAHGANGEGSYTDLRDFVVSRYWPSAAASAGSQNP